MDKIGICGGGLIGASWALGFSSNKYKVFVYDNSKKVREEFLNTVKGLYEDLSILKDISFNEIKSNIVICEAIEDICKDATLIQESIIENLEEKQNIFIELDKFSNKETILASSSSYLLPSEIGSKIKHKNRFIDFIFLFFLFLFLFSRFFVKFFQLFRMHNRSFYRITHFFILI